MTTTRTVAFYNLELKDIVVRPIRGDDGFILAPWVDRYMSHLHRMQQKNWSII